MYNSNYITTKEACKLTGFKPPTLRLWDNKGKVRTLRTSSNQRLYCRMDLLQYIGYNENKKIIYCYRIKNEDITDHIRSTYFNYEIIHDDFLKILNKIINEKIEEIVILYKNYFCSDEYNIIKSIIQKYEGNVINVKL